MIAQVFGYAMVIALLVGLAAASAERSMAELGLPRRFAWLGAYTAALAFPAIALWLAAGTAAPAGANVVNLSATAAPWYANVDWDAVLVVAWAAGTVLMLVVYLGTWLRLTVVAKRWPRLESDFGHVAVSDDVGPAVLGIFAPRVVLPRWLVAAPASARSIVMAHEREHIAARDPMVIVASQIVTILLPWNLPLWWFARRLRTAIEIDCDARVLRTGVDPAHYGDVLLAVGQHRSSSQPMAATLIEPVAQLERRIRIMLVNPRPVSQGRFIAALALALGVAACATRIEPPVIVASSKPAGTEAQLTGVKITARTIEFRTAEGTPARVNSVGEGVLHFFDADQGQVTSERVSVTSDGVVFEGNVRIEYDGTSIATNRAVFKEAPDGSATLSLDAAVVTSEAR